MLFGNTASVCFQSKRNVQKPTEHRLLSHTKHSNLQLHTAKQHSVPLCGQHIMYYEHYEHKNSGAIVVITGEIKVRNPTVGYLMCTFVCFLVDFCFQFF